MSSGIGVAIFHQVSLTAEYGHASGQNSGQYFRMHFGSVLFSLTSESILTDIYADI
jgi:hypothetical protein